MRVPRISLYNSQDESSSDSETGNKHLFRQQATRLVLLGADDGATSRQKMATDLQLNEEWQQCTEELVQLKVVKMALPFS